MTEDEMMQQRQKNLPVLIKTFRFMGAVLMLAGVAIAFNFAGIAGLLGIADDDFLCKITGGMAVLIGLFDFVVMPHILARQIRPPQ